MTLSSRRWALGVAGLAASTLAGTSEVMAQSETDAPAVILDASDCPDLEWARFERLAPMVRVELRALGRPHDIVRSGPAAGVIRLRISDCGEPKTVELTAVPRSESARRRRVDLSDVHPTNRTRTLGLALADLWHATSPGPLGPDGLPPPVRRPAPSTSTATGGASTPDPTPPAPPGATPTPIVGAGVDATPPAPLVTSTDAERARVGTTAAGELAAAPRTAPVVGRPSAIELAAAGRVAALFGAPRLLRGGQVDLTVPLRPPRLRGALGASFMVDREVSALGTVDFFVPAVHLGLELTAPVDGAHVGGVHIGGRAELTVGLALTEVATGRDDVNARDELDVVVGLAGLVHVVWFFVPDVFVRIDVGVDYAFRSVRLDLIDGEAGWFGAAAVGRLAVGMPL